MRKQQFSLILLLVLIPLVNLGPSLHRLSFFGYHHADCCQTLAVTSDRSCGTPGGCCASAKGGDLASKYQLDLIEAIAAEEHDCPFCRFFDQFHVDQLGQRQVAFTGWNQGTIELNSEVARSLDRQPTARGPPCR